MDSKIKCVDRKLDSYLDELNQNLQNQDARGVYSQGRIILEYILNNLGKKKKVRIIPHFGRLLSINDCLEDDDIKECLKSIGVSLDDCLLIKKEDNYSEYSNFDFNIEELSYNVNEIKEYIDLLFSIMDKICKECYGFNIDIKNNCSTIFMTLEMQSMSFNVEDDDIDYESLDEDLLDDPVQRLPICFCLDLSGSMRKLNKFGLLKEAVETFSKLIMSDPKAKESAEVAVICFNNEFKVIREFSRVDDVITLGDVAPMNQTLISGAVNKALELLNARKKEYFKTGVEYYQPWLVIISDGLPGDDCTKIKKKIYELEENRKLTVFSIPIIPSTLEDSKKIAVKEFMDGFSVNKSQEVDSKKIVELFKWFSKSVSLSVRSIDQHTTVVDSNKNWKL